MSSVSSQIALITGGASGIGLATAILLKKAGWLICLVDRNVEVGEKEAKNLDCEFYQTDVTDYSSLASTFDKAYIKHGRLDFVFANAGIMVSQLVVDINLKSVIDSTYLAQHYFRLSQKNGGSESPAIVLTSSIGGLYPTFHLPAYSAAKFGVVGIMHSIAPICYAKDKIRVSSICPSGVRTNLMSQEGWDVFPAHLFTGVEEVATAVKVLIDDQSSSGRMMEIVGKKVYPRKQHEYSDSTTEMLLEGAKAAMLPNS